jgi:hypothetical protein
MIAFFMRRIFSTPRTITAIGPISGTDNYMTMQTALPGRFLHNGIPAGGGVIPVR